jgi:hypothetical protein
VLKALVNAAKHNQSACDPGWRGAERSAWVPKCALFYRSSG